MLSVGGIYGVHNVIARIGLVSQSPITVLLGRNVFAWVPKWSKMEYRQLTASEEKHQHEVHVSGKSRQSIRVTVFLKRQQQGQ